MRGGSCLMRPDPRDFRLEQGDALLKFGLRIGAQILGREARGCILRGARAIRLIHHRCNIRP
jgi:hypothetical protein